MHATSTERGGVRRKCGRCAGHSGLRALEAACPPHELLQEVKLEVDTLTCARVCERAPLIRVLGSRRLGNWVEVNNHVQRADRSIRKGNRFGLAQT